MLTTVASARSQQSPAIETISFNRDVRPILSNRCFQCHGPDENSRVTELRLDSRDSAMSDLGGYRAVIPEDAEQSELILRINHEDPDLLMPPSDSGKRLTDQEKKILANWIEQGAKWPEFWAYLAPKKQPEIIPGDRDWGNGWIDSMVLRTLNSRQLTPSPRADNVTTIRRLHFDLTGLPPTIEQIQRFLQDDSSSAYEQIVDELLASPHFGERMAMYWLDLVRYADTVGYHGDQDHNISPYRSWVIDAFNDNKPFDQFTREQLAGDLLPAPTPDQRIATGYNRLLQTTHEGGLQPNEYRAIYAADRVRNISAVWMGATLGCAQCHDHKYDPYTAKDFYAMAAFFADIDDEQHFKVGTNSLPTRRPPELLVISEEHRQHLNALDRKIKLAEKESRSLEEKNKKLDGEALAQGKKERDRLKSVIASLKGERKKIESLGDWTMITQALPEPRVVRVLPRGNWLDESGQIVEPAVPEFMNPIKTEGRATRMDLAIWLTDPSRTSGQLTARVMANRIWFLFMGSGVSPSLDDFGGQGEPPANPELLDSLAWDFIDSGWNVKQLIKEIVTSETYRQSSVETPHLRDTDPYNQLFGRQSRYRLPAEVLRDNALAISGLLNLDEVGGRSVKPFQPAGYYQHLNFPPRTYKQNEDQRQWRRGIYIHWQRQFLHPTLKSLDAPSREECTPKRARSNTPLAALALLNDPSFIASAKIFAEQIQRQSKGDPKTGLDFAFETATSRKPDDAEKKILLDLYQTCLSEYQNDPIAARKLTTRSLLDGEPVDADQASLAAWISVARALLNLDETITRN
ncbi:MAG: PSD1 and planctomycete cytochrome C domain-containing protein [Mariniblastus sp.]|nr:PSD1 and planctomycete cytochrome C domain-containing protein [Mariniblastus sp.]